VNKVIAFEKKSRNGSQRKSGKLEVKNITESSADLYIYGYIDDSKWDETDVVPSDIKEFIDQVKDVKTLNIYINSGGGSVWAGMAIYSMLHRMNAYKTVYVDGLAASMASVIAFCGDKLIIPSNAYLMIHKPMTFAWGNADELLEVAAMLDKVEEGILNVYEENMAEGVDISTIKQLVAAESWLTGKTAAEYFKIEVGEENKAVAYGDLSEFKNPPKAIFTNETETDKKQRELAKLELAFQISESKNKKRRTQ